MGDRQRDLLACSLDHPPLQPLRAVRRMSRDDHLVGGEVPQRVLQRGVRLVVVADLAAGANPRFRHAAQRVVQSPPGLLECSVDVGCPVLDPRAGQCGDNDEDLAAPALAAVLDLGRERLPAHRLVGHHQHPVGRILAVSHLGTLSHPPLRSTPQHPDAEADLGGQQGGAHRGARQQGEDDHRAGTDSDDHHRAKHVLLGPQRVMHPGPLSLAAPDYRGRAATRASESRTRRRRAGSSASRRRGRSRRRTARGRG